MTLKKLLLIVAGGVGILGALLPWYRASLFGYTASSNAFQMGALYIILAILAILCSAATILINAMKEKQIKKLIKIKDFKKLSLIISIAMVVIVVIAFIAIQSESKGFGSPSWGIWLMALSGICAIVLTCLNNVEQLNKVVMGKAEKSDKADKPAKKEESKKSTK